MNNIGPFHIATLVAALILSPSIQAAEAWPSKPIKIVVGLAPGGGTDINTRIVAAELQKRLGQPVVVENRPGAAGTIAAGAVARVPADGYTFLMVSSSYTTSYATVPRLNFDPFKDLISVAQILSGPFCIVAHPSVQANSVEDLIKLAKSKPTGLSYASSGVGGAGHLAGELFNDMAGTRMVHVPYKGSAPAITDVLAGRVDLLFAELATVNARVKTGELKLIAVTTKNRVTSAMEVATVSESGLPGYVVSGWMGLLAPAGLPQPILARMNREIVDVVGGVEVGRQFGLQGVDPQTGSAASLQAMIESELRLWRSIAERRKIVAE